MHASATRVFFAAILAAGPLFAAAAQAESRAQEAWSERGEATWYGPRHAGHRTTSGETFDPSKMTAAHPSLPLGTWVRVTVDNTGASVVVRVNDREPPHGVRCIDLSHEAAARLGIVARGHADVSIAAVSGPEATEVAEAPDDAQPVEHAVSARHGRRHRHHALR